MLANSIFKNFQKEFSPKHSSFGEDKVIVIYGPPCTGKTTLSKILAKQYNVHRLSMDVIRKYYPKTELFTEANNNEVLDLFLKQLRFLKANRQPVICEGFFYSDNRKSQLKRVVSGSKVFFIYLSASLITLNQRLEKRNLIGLNSEGISSENLTHEQLEHFYNLSVPNNYTNLIVNTELLTIDESITRICNSLNQKLAKPS